MYFCICFNLFITTPHSTGDHLTKNLLFLYNMNYITGFLHEAKCFWTQFFQSLMTLVCWEHIVTDTVPTGIEMNILQSLYNHKLMWILICTQCVYYWCRHNTHIKLNTSHLLIIIYLHSFLLIIFQYACVHSFTSWTQLINNLFT